MLRESFICLLIVCSAVFAGLPDDSVMSDYKDYLENGTPVLWNKFPYYSVYEKILEKWGRDYSHLCKVINLGPSVNNRKIFAVKISDNVNLHEAEPALLQTAASNGDDIVNYILTLHIIDTLLLSYGNDDRITNLVNSAELWFCPLINPDGMYYGGDETIRKSRRYNANQKTLFQNFPCPCLQGNHAEYGIYDSLELEIKAVIKLHEMCRFNLFIDMNFGTEVILWPYGAISDIVCDEGWFKWVVKRHTDQVHEDCNNNGYMTVCGGDGMGHFFTEMYESHGTILDYCVYFRQIKGVLLHTARQMSIPISNPLRYRCWQEEALFRYYELLYTGIQGVVIDASTKRPIANVTVTAENHDYKNAHVFTGSTGFYTRFIESGTYTLTFSHDNYLPKTVDTVVIDDYTKKYSLDVELDPITDIKNMQDRSYKAFVPVYNNSKITLSWVLKEPVKIDIYSINGRRITSLVVTMPGRFTWDGKDACGNKVGNGCYVAYLESLKK